MEPGSTGPIDLISATMAARRCAVVGPTPTASPIHRLDKNTIQVYGPRPSGDAGTLGIGTTRALLRRRGPSDSDAAPRGDGGVRGQGSFESHSFDSGHLSLGAAPGGRALGRACGHAVFGLARPGALWVRGAQRAVGPWPWPNPNLGGATAP